MAQAATKILGLALTYVAFHYTTKVCEAPLALIVRQIEQKGLVNAIVDLAAYIEDSIVGTKSRSFQAPEPKKTKQTKKPARSSAPASQAMSPPRRKQEIPVGELCDRCVDNRKTMERLRTVATSMGLPYPGEEIQPCEMCRDRADRLHDLEQSLLSPKRRSM